MVNVIEVPEGPSRPMSAGQIGQAIASDITTFCPPGALLTHFVWTPTAPGIPIVAEAEPDATERQLELETALQDAKAKLADKFLVSQSLVLLRPLHHARPTEHYVVSRDELAEDILAIEEIEDKIAEATAASVRAADLSEEKVFDVQKFVSEEMSGFFTDAYPDLARWLEMQAEADREAHGG